MGAFNKKKPLIHIKPKDATQASAWGWDEYEEIVLDPNINTEQTDSITYGGEQGRQLTALCQALIVDWNLVDENGVKMEVTPATIAALPPDYSMRVMLEAPAAMGKAMPEGAMPTFTKPVPTSTPGA